MRKYWLRELLRRPDEGSGGGSGNGSEPPSGPAATPEPSPPSGPPSRETQIGNLPEDIMSLFDGEPQATPPAAPPSEGGDPQSPPPPSTPSAAPVPGQATPPGATPQAPVSPGPQLRQTQPFWLGKSKPSRNWSPSNCVRGRLHKANHRLQLSRSYQLTNTR